MSSHMVGTLLGGELIAIQITVMGVAIYVFIRIYTNVYPISLQLLVYSKHEL